MPRPVVIAVANQKGGVGKSTLTGHLAVKASTEQAGPVILIDTDEQGSLSAWWNNREAPEPAFVSLPELAVLARVIDTVGQGGGSYVFIDTPPQATAAIAEVIEQADFVLIPIRPSPHDLRAVGRTIEIVHAAGKPFAFVVTQAKQNALLTVQAMGALSAHGTVSSTVIHDRVDYAASMSNGLTVLETDPKGRSAGEVSDLWAFIKERLNASAHERKSAKPQFLKGAAA